MELNPESVESLNPDWGCKHCLYTEARSVLHACADLVRQDRSALDGFDSYGRVSSDFRYAILLK